MWRSRHARKCNLICARRKGSVFRAPSLSTGRKSFTPVGKIWLLHVVLYGCVTWSLTLREELKMMVFENRVLRRIFGGRRDELTGEWRKLHNEELNDLYSSPNIMRIIKSRRKRWAGHVACMGESTGVYRILVG